jgi:Fe-S cluster assembly ATP-binding protein
MLEINNLRVSIDKKTILQNFSLKVKPGEIHAIMGPNGAGKSTLAKVLAGHPSYEVEEGRVFFCEKNILELQPEQRSHLGIFVSFQYPIEISGISNFQFLFNMHKAQCKAKNVQALVEEEFREKVENIAMGLNIKKDFLDRDINAGFSGGEKKRNEILQMSVLSPSLALLDETDSGLDIDALKTIAEGINRQMSKEKAMIVITHYQRLLDYIKPDFVHVMIRGRIVKSGPPELAHALEEKGYDWL